MMFSIGNQFFLETGFKTTIIFYQESVLDLKNTGGNVLVTDDSLILRHVTEQQEGSYRCVAKNQVGSGASNIIELTVKCKSYI